MARLIAFIFGAVPTHERARRFFHRLFTRAVICHNCPHFRIVGVKKLKLQARASSGLVGVCFMDRIGMQSWPEIRATYPVRNPGDWCDKHPLYTPHVGADLTYKPDKPGHDAAGFNRPPNLGEALRLAQIVGPGAQSETESKPNGEQSNGKT